MLEEELERLTDEINEQKEPSAFLLARRGALCRKVCLESLDVIWPDIGHLYFIGLL